MVTCCTGNCNQGREGPDRKARRDAAEGANHAIKADQLLASGAIEGPFRRTKPVTRGPVRRLIRALLAFLLAPRPYI